MLGALLEKAVTTPDQYPLTLNAVRSACNQKSSREPVMALSEGEVQSTLRSLETKLLVSPDPNLRGRTEKYQQRFCKPPFGIYDFDDAQYAVLTVLMLRGPATPGELRTRTERMHNFANNEAVLETLHGLQNWTPDALVTELPKAPNRRDSCWAQLFGERGAAETAAAKPANPVSKPHGDAARLTALEARVSELEATLAKLQRELGD